MIDRYDAFLARMMRHNLPEYHSFFKRAGFVTENGAAEFVVAVSDEIHARYRELRHAAEAAGYQIVALRQVAEAQRVEQFTPLWNQAYATHWGLAPLIPDEVAAILSHQPQGKTLDLSALAYRDGQPVGAVLVIGEESGERRWSWRKSEASEQERLPSFAIGVLAGERGRGLGLGLAAHAYLQLIAGGARFLSYGLVLDDNHASRRFAEKLGAFPSSNYVTYRRPLI